MVQSRHIDPSVKARINAMTESAYQEIDNAADWHIPKLPPRFILSPELKARLNDPDLCELFREGRFWICEAPNGKRLV